MNAVEKGLHFIAVEGQTAPVTGACDRKAQRARQGIHIRGSARTPHQVEPSQKNVALATRAGRFPAFQTKLNP